ncbi:diguanylate cyclase [Paucibacter sp. DJ1R-11]|uniref:sensor domain-containing diguanylate cyclase n=1 Tax=Paucibacter sp. DJ1R-11 TaxID=2893556 RepID=UPI0021E3F8F5|nr:diguanylate cyclase [Paucibacter sp. DJ1R-11]MCV2362134.1 diguanylate cyclase [Paucibacter sp. DJ1R-11]
MSTLTTAGSPGRNTALMFLRFSAAALLLALLLLLVQAPPTWAALAVLAALLALLPSLRRPQHSDRERQLLEAIEAMPAGFDLWDADDRLLMCNRRVREDYAQVAEHLVEGRHFEDVVRQSLQAGYVTEARGREEAWLAERLAGRGQQSGPRLQQFGERWLHLYEQRTTSGLLVCIRLDVTELVKTQQALAQAQAAAHSERQLLERAIDAMPAGIEIYDEQDRLLLANRRVVGWMPHLDYEHMRGQSFAHMLALTREAGALPLEALGDEDAWIATRLAGRGRNEQAQLQQLANGIWLRLTETLTPEGYLVAVRQDVSDLLLKERELQASQAQLQAIIMTAGVAIVTIDAQGHMLSCNPAVERLFGHRAEEMLGQNVSLLMDEPDRGSHDHYLSRREGSEGARELPLLGRTREFNALHKSGRALTVQVSVSEVKGPQGKLYVGVINDLTERKQFEIELQHANEQLLRLSTTDALTELANRRLLMQKLEEEWRRGLRLGTPLSLLLIDVDHFKLYNDHYGHQAGDACLIRVAEALRTSAGRPTDVVARYGGEEFVLLLAQTDSVGALAVAERCRKEIARAAIEHEVSPLGPELTISIGVISAVPLRGGSASQWLAQADLALYQAKAQGRNRAVSAPMFSPI